MLFDGVDRVRGSRREGRRDKRDGSRKRGEKCKNMEWRKKENFSRAAPRWEEGDKGREGRGLPPVPPLIFKNIGDDSYGFK